MTPQSSPTRSSARIRRQSVRSRPHETPLETAVGGMDVTPAPSAPRPVVADMSVTPWSVAVETPLLCAAIQVPPACVQSVEDPAPPSPSPVESPGAPPPTIQFRLAKPIMRSSRHRRRSRGHTFPRSPYPVEQFLALRRPDGEPWLGVTRLLKAEETYKLVPRPRRQANAQGVFDDFFKHVGGRMACGDLAIILSPRLDLPYIRLAEEVMYVHRLDALLDRVLSGSSPSFHDYELFVFVGALRHWYGWNRDHFGKDLWDEHRLRGSAKHYANSVFGWHNRSFHHIPLEVRSTMFWPMPDDWAGFEANRILGVPSPAVAHYATTSYLATAVGSPARQVLDRIFILEYLCNFVLSHAQASSDGIYYTTYPDRRMKRDYRRAPGGHVGRLCRLPPRVVQELAQIHPFFFLESAGIDPARAFLALRRAQEFVWDEKVCAGVAYNFQTGEPLPLPKEVFDNQTREGNHPGETRVPPRELRTYTAEACTPTAAVSPCTLRSCELAYERFKTLSRGCSGNSKRVQLSRVITRIMNGENFGIESSALTNLRKSGIVRSNLWDVPTQAFDRPAEQSLSDLAAYAASLPDDPEDAGLSFQPSGSCNHPPGILLPANSPRPVPNVSAPEDDEAQPLEYEPGEALLQHEFYGPPPDWLPEQEGYHELEDAFYRLQAAHRSVEVLPVPNTVCGGLELAAHNVRRVRELTQSVRSFETANHNLTVNRNNLRDELSTVREENTRLRHAGSSSSADARLGAIAQERDAARASLATVESERDTARAALAAMEAERDAALQSVTALTAARDAACADLTASQAALTRVRGELTAARTGGSSVQAVQTELDGVRAELTAVESDLTAARADLATARTARAAADRRATRIVSAVQSQLGELVTTLSDQVQTAADEVAEEARKAAAGESSSNSNKRPRGA